MLHTTSVSRRAFLAAMGIAVAGTSTRTVAQSTTVTKRIPIFNGKDLSNWYTHLNGGLGKNNDPKKVYSVQDGMLRVSGEVNGGLMTLDEYSNYRLVAEYKWGEKAWPPRDKGAMDCGLLLHCGNEDAVAVGTWPQCIQFQIYQGSVGDLVLLPGKDILTASIEGEQVGENFYYKAGAPAVAKQAGGTKRFDITNHGGKDPEWKNVKGFYGKNTAEKPHDQWNTIEAIADGDTLTYIVNGRTVNQAKKLSLTKGHIGIQSESFEAFFRRIELLPLK